MCTNKTLEAKIRRFNELNELKKTIEAERETIQAAIIAEYETRGINAYTPKSGSYNARLINQTRETITKKSLSAALPETWEAIWSAAAVRSSSNYIRVYSK